MLPGKPGSTLGVLGLIKNAFKTRYPQKLGCVGENNKHQQKLQDRQTVNTLAVWKVGSKLDKKQQESCCWRLTQHGGQLPKQAASHTVQRGA